MKENKRGLPIKEGLLDRPRIYALLDEAVKHSLVTVVAGAGYGKTQAVAAYVNNIDKRLIWMRLSKLDNIAPRFWYDFIMAARAELPEFADELVEIEIPNTLEEYDILLRNFSSEVYKGQQVIFVVDGYDNIYDSEVLHFFEYLVEANLENFCLILISDVKIDGDILRLCRSEAYQIDMAQLRFTKQEIYDFFALNHIDLTKEALKVLEECTEGWPLAVCLLAQQPGIHDSIIADPLSIDLEIVNQMFERDYFLNYNEMVRRIFIKLSILQDFSIDIIHYIDEGDSADVLTALKTNMFVAYDQASRSLRFQNMYRAFLINKQDLLNEEEIEKVHAIAGDYYLKHNQIWEAIEHYNRCGKYVEILEIICSYNSSGMDKELAEYFLQHIELFPQKVLEENPVTEYLKATIKLNNMEIDEAAISLEELEKKLLKRLEHKQDKEIEVLLGEVYITLAAISIMESTTQFVEYYKKANKFLPEGSRLKKEDMMFVQNYDMLILSNTQPGALEEMMCAIEEAMPYVDQVLHGSGYGLEHLFFAEAAYHTYDMAKAKEEAFQAIYKAQEKNQYDIVCNARFILANVAFMYGDYDEIVSQVYQIVDYINEKDRVELYDLRDCVQSWFQVKMGDLNKISPWILSPRLAERDRPPIMLGRDKLIYARYLIRSENYFELLDLISWEEKWFAFRGWWIGMLNFIVMKAIGYLELKDEKKAMETLWQAYELSYHNGIIAPFIEGAKHMCALVEVARQNPQYGFNEVWLDDIYQKSSAYSKRLSAMMKEYAKRNLKSAEFNIKLTKREIEILYGLSQGFTREEIAEEVNVSVNTIKSNIKNIYNKLSAVNRADAIRIATALGLLDSDNLV
jgi:LuxR family maltose regulon positive regulatory protein